ncbi:hypothetical protein BJX70DRAFT_394847 [Aspergillus crustosus]
MPSVEVAVSSPASLEHQDRLLLRSHKSLPRRTKANHDGQLSQLSTLGQNGQLSDGLPLATAPILPLTPPGNTLEESPTGTDVLKPTPSDSVIAVLTPSKPSHPPTPETTPPRSMASGRPGLSHFGYISSSSRAESFQTAYERISDSETETPRPSPPSLSRSNTKRSARSTNSTGQDTLSRINVRTRDTTPAGDDESPIPRSSTHSKVPIGRLPQGPEKQSQALGSRRQEAPNVSPPELRIRPTRATPKRSRNAVDVEVAGVDGRTRGRSLRDRVETMQEVEDSLEMDLFRQEIGWPSEYDQLSATEFGDSRRISGVSTSSTVEAMIIDPPKPARRALRHTEKRLSLRSASSPITKSEHTSIASSSDLQRRLSHKPARITEIDRASIVSDMSISGSSTLGAPQQFVDVVPVIVIPQRNSSLKGPSNPNSRNPSISRSRRSSRPPTAPKSRPGSLDLSRQRKRTVSDSKVPADIRGRGMSRPYIPPRSSSLSAPTSQNNSRSTSLTSESLRSHSLAVEQLKVKRQPEQPDAKQQRSIPVPTPNVTEQDTHETTDLPKTQTILIGVEDLNYLRPPSLFFTPRSIPSSSPGPFEINEVRRVAIFPHNNESLLLVNPQGQSGLREELRQVAQPQTPDIGHYSSTNVDSPLRNPRPPPQLLVSTAVTKYEHNPDQMVGEANGELEAATVSNRRSGYKRRGWIARPRSESFNSFVRSLSLNSAKNPKAGKDIDGRLQPFWRPRRFWDDSPETLSPEEDGPKTQISQQPDEVISNSLGVPQKRIVFDGPTLPSPRPGAKRRIDGYHRANRETLVGSRIFTPDALYSQTSLHQRQFPALSWWRLRFRSGMVRSLRWRFRRSVQRRAEGRREARREKLKQSIGEAVLAHSSTQVRTAIQ